MKNGNMQVTSMPCVPEQEPDGYLIFFRTGYEDEKRTIEDTVLLALLHPEVYDEVAKGTRQREAGSTRPRAVLFQGPPGCGKTTSAKWVQPDTPLLWHSHMSTLCCSPPHSSVTRCQIDLLKIQAPGMGAWPTHWGTQSLTMLARFPGRVIASQAAVPLVYVPLEAVASKWYGESERNLSEIFKAAEDLGGAIIFLDEIDSLATQRRLGTIFPLPCLLVHSCALDIFPTGWLP